jgi:hypothetical protein
MPLTLAKLKALAPLEGDPLVVRWLMLPEVAPREVVVISHRPGGILLGCAIDEGLEDLVEQYTEAGEESEMIGPS